MLNFRSLEMRSISGRDTVLGGSNIELIREINERIRVSIETLKNGYTETEYNAAVRLANMLMYVTTPYYYNTAIQKTVYGIFRERREQLFYLLNIY